MSTKGKYNPIPDWVNQGALYHRPPAPPPKKEEQKTQSSIWEIIQTLTSFILVTGFFLLALMVASTTR